MTDCIFDKELIHLDDDQRYNVFSVQVYEDGTLKLSCVYEDYMEESVTLTEDAIGVLEKAITLSKGVRE